MTEARIWDYLAEHDEAIREMRADGVTVPEIARMVRARKQKHVTEYCAQHGIGSAYHGLSAPGGIGGAGEHSWQDRARAASANLAQAIRTYHPERAAA